MIEWLTDTLVMTGALLALVLLVRRPVARWFGPQAAYALWALPMIRLVLPPLALPLPRTFLPEMPTISVQPLTAQAVPAQSAASGAEVAITLPVDAASLHPVAEPGVLSQLASNLSLPIALLVVWLGGAAMFMMLRIWNYRMMRRQVLAGARHVASAEGIRIVESPAVSAPLAFGVFEKFVALPEGFLAYADSETSDFAVAHELEHHAGNDLLALMVVQPLFALHWFNPVGWMGWRAFRGDQETACDARVMAGRCREEKARYGQLLASFAGSPRLTLAAPMAGVISGEKPVIQRLRALTREDVTPVQSLLGRSLFALAVGSVPLTATVSYAAMEEQGGWPAAPAAPLPPLPVVDPDVPAVPVAPAVPGALREGEVPAVPRVPGLPEVPSLPEAPAAPLPPVSANMVPPAPPAPPVPPVPPLPSKAFLQKAAYRTKDGEARMYMDHEMARRVAEAQRKAMERAPDVQEFVSSDGKVRTVRIVQRDGEGKQVSVREMRLDSRCAADSQRSNGRGAGSGTSEAHVICTGAPATANDMALKALRQARASIAGTRGLDRELRKEMLADLDSEIAETLADAND